MKCESGIYAEFRPRIFFLIGELCSILYCYIDPAGFGSHLCYGFICSVRIVSSFLLRHRDRQLWLKAAADNFIDFNNIEYTETARQVGIVPPGDTGSDEALLRCGTCDMRAVTPGATRVRGDDTGSDVFRGDDTGSDVFRGDDTGSDAY